MVLLPFLSIAQDQNNANGNWPLEMNSSKNFDIASKCEMLVFVEVFNDFDAFSTSELSVITKVKNVNEKFVNQWKKETKERFLQ